MFQVILMYGDNEPWWFFEDWQEDIIEETKFEEFTEAVQAYQEKYQELDNSYERVREKGTYLTAFWNEGEFAFCEDCDDDAQQYKGLLILKDNKKLTETGKETDETVNHSREAKRCQRPSQGFGSH